MGKVVPLLPVPFLNEREINNFNLTGFIQKIDYSVSEHNLESAIGKLFFLREVKYKCLLIKSLDKTETLYYKLY